MASVESVKLWEFSRTPFRALVVVAVAGLGIWCPAAFGKGPLLNAIELYDGPSGPAYVQLSEVLINGKLELRSCASMDSSPIDKSAYGKMSKLTIAAGGILERDSNGVLRYGTSDGAGSCVVPEGVKFEHNATFTAAAIADMADLRGATADASAAQPLKKGVKLVFLVAPDAERAEYM